MKIILLCSLPGEFDLDRACRREEFPALQTAFYQALPREAAPGKTASGAYIYYCSPLPAAAHTLRHAFGQVPAQTAEALGEPLFPVPESMKEAAPFRRWLQEGVKAFRKSDAWAQARAESKAFLAELERQDADCVLISHPERLRILLSLLKKEGYLIEKPRIFGIRPLDRIRASHKSLHCGGCRHNCLLSEAKCHIGRDKARLRR